MNSILAAQYLAITKRVYVYIGKEWIIYLSLQLVNKHWEKYMYLKESERDGS